MAENVQITPGSGVTIGADSVVDISLGSAQIQYIKIMDGSIGGTNKAGVGANGLLIDGSGVTQPISAVSLPLPTGAATSANQTTELSYLSTIVTNTANSGTPTVSGTVTVLQPTAANLNATVTQTVAGNLVTKSLLNDGSGNAISSSAGSLSVAVTNFPATQAVTQSGSWTVSLSSESIEIGTVDQGTPNTLANAWPVKPTDGTNSQSYTALGEAKVSITEPLPAGTNLIGHVIVDSSTTVTNLNTFEQNLAVSPNSTTTLYTYTVPASVTYQLNGFIGWGTYTGEWLVTVNSANKGGGWSSAASPTLQINYGDTPIVANTGDVISITVTNYATTSQTFRLNVLAQLTM